MDHYLMQVIVIVIPVRKIVDQMGFQPRGKFRCARKRAMLTAKCAKHLEISLYEASVSVNWMVGRNFLLRECFCADCQQPLNYMKIMRKHYQSLVRRGFVHITISHNRVYMNPTTGVPS